MALEAPLDFPCPTCRVLPGEHCRMRDVPQTPRQALTGTNDTHVARIRKAASHNRRMAKKRGYSREFKPHGDTGKRYLLDKIPAGLWSEARAKAKRDGISMRALILQLLDEWLKK